MNYTLVSALKVDNVRKQRKKYTGVDKILKAVGMQSELMENVSQVEHIVGEY
jgi:hypothetical protein